MAQYECYRNHEHPSPIDLFKFNVCIRYYFANSNHIHHEIIFNNLPTIVCKQFFSQAGRLYLRAHFSEEPLPSDTLDYIITQLTYAIQQSYNIDFDYNDDADVENHSENSQPREFSMNLILEIQECDIGDEQETELVNDEEGYEESIEEFGTCAICMDEFDHVHVDLNNDIGTSRIFRMPCNHVFHQQCIVTWLQTSRTCPLCRYPMPTTLPNRKN